MIDAFVDVYAKSTGQKQRIPKHWLDHPVLGRDFVLTPSARAVPQAQEAADPGADLGAAPGDVEPKISWTREQLDAHAAGLGIETTGLRAKADVLAAIESPSTPTGDDPTVVDPSLGDDTGDATGVDPTPNSDDTPSTDQTPAAGENQE